MFEPNYLGLIVLRQLQNFYIYSRTSFNKNLLRERLKNECFFIPLSMSHWYFCNGVMILDPGIFNVFYITNFTPKSAYDKALTGKLATKKVSEDIINLLLIFSSL